MMDTSHTTDPMRICARWEHFVAKDLPKNSLAVPLRAGARRYHG